MAMVGAFTGWQAVWIGFFLAPLVGLVFVVSIYLTPKMVRLRLALTSP